MNLLDFAPEIVSLITSFLKHNERLQLNRVSKYFNIELSKEQFVEYVKETNADKLSQQITNPYWTKKYGLFPLPLGEIGESLDTKFILEAFKNSDFPTIRAMIILYGPNNIKLTVNKDDFPFIGEIEKKYRHTFDEIITFNLPILFAHKFGCNMEVCKQIYELIYNMKKLFRYRLYFDYFGKIKMEDIDVSIDRSVYNILYGDNMNYFKKMHANLTFCSMNYNNVCIGKLVY